MENKEIASNLKLNDEVSMEPLMSSELKREIYEASEEELKLQMDKLDQFEKEEEERLNSRCSSAISYIISNPVFTEDVLRNIESKMSNVTEEKKTESLRKETFIIRSLKMQSKAIEDESEEEEEDYDDDDDYDYDVDDEEAYNFNDQDYYYFDVEPEKDEKEEELKNWNNFQAQMKLTFSQLIERQKLEYLTATDELKEKFAIEQNEFMNKFQLTVQESFPTFTPLLHNSLADKAEGNSNNVEKQLTESEIRERAATKINAYVRGYLVRRLMRTYFVEKHISNVKDTLKIILNISDFPTESPDAEQSYAIKRYFLTQLQVQLCKFNDIFNNYSTERKMSLIANDRYIRRLNIAVKNKALSNSSTQTV